MLNKNQTVTIEITGITGDGSGVGRHDGMAIFVPNTAIGDIAEVKILKPLKSYAFGKLERVITPSSDRADADCRIFTKCGGCVFRHISYQAELGIKDSIVRDAFARIGGINPEFDDILGCDDTDGYRNKAQYPVGRVNGNIVYGFYARKSHRIVPAEECALQPPEFDTVVKTIMGYVREKSIEPYDEQNHSGLLRHICIRMGHYSKQMQVCLVVTKRCDAVFKELAERLAKHQYIKSFILNINSKKTNVIMGDKCITLFGSDAIIDTMCGIKVSLSPLSFYQINTPQAERLYSIAAEYAQLSGKETVLDMYCGAGIIGLSMAKKAGQIIGVESIEQAVFDAQKNARLNGIDNARFLCADAANAAGTLLTEGIRPNVVILDPPRKGCEKKLLDTVAGMNPSGIVMISCNPATAARDCAILEQAGYKAVRARAVDMFPRTGHVETVVLMSRVKVNTMF